MIRMIMMMMMMMMMMMTVLLRTSHMRNDLVNPAYIRRAVNCPSV